MFAKALLKWLLLSALALSGASVALAGDSDKPPVAWLRSHAIPLKTVEAGHGFDDMQPLRGIVGGARIVELGEATHGSREFFQLKHRMLEFLVSQMGFTIFSIEANMPEAYRLTDFVVNGNGDPKQLLKGMYFWTWNTEEVLDMILWMREFNRSGKGHIEFTGFDMQTPTIAMDIVRTFAIVQDGPFYPTLEPIYQRVARTTQSQANAFGVATAKFPLEVAAGKHIKFSGYIKTEGITRGWAGLWWRVDGTEMGKLLAFDNMQDRGAKGTTPWTRYEISLDVPANATNINFGVLHAGDGTAWFDSLAIEIDGKPYTDTGKFDLDFESTAPTGFHTGGDGYEVALDKSMPHSGKQSLRSRSLATQSSGDQELSNELLVSGCKEVLQHLESNRANYLRAGSTRKSIDWVIQNARIVLQSQQMKTHEKLRDESMAENIEWIADQNPGAKLVIWAHNGHVAYGGYSGYKPMGSYLRDTFGIQLVNFGFAFNEGSFQAWMGKSLHDFTVGPAPDGSLDRVFADSNIPTFALDLRQIPNAGPVADWFSKPHVTRSIGALYQESEPHSYLLNARPQDAFDAMFFVEKTSAARENP
jgi:erythromycin esterase-like protein